eukprot:1436553-Amphidinium_carterae.1
MNCNNFRHNYMPTRLSVVKKVLRGCRCMQRVMCGKRYVPTRLLLELMCIVSDVAAACIKKSKHEGSMKGCATSPKLPRNSPRTPGGPKGTLRSNIGI